MNRSKLTLINLTIILLFNNTIILAGENDFNTVWTDVPWGQGGLTPSGGVSSMNGPFDIDQDGYLEFVASSGWAGSFGNEIMVYEVVDNNVYELVFWYNLLYLDNTDCTEEDPNTCVFDAFSNVTVGDLDNDGLDEIIALVDADPGQAGLLIFEWDGVTNWDGWDNYQEPETPTVTWDLNLPEGVFESGDILVTNLDSDPNDEVVVSIMHSWDFYAPNNSTVMIFELNQETTFDFPVWHIEMIDNSSFAYSGYMVQDTDMDNDGYREIIAVDWNSFKFVMYENTEEDSYEFQTEFYVSLVWDAFCNDCLAEADLDNDGLNELYLATSSAYEGGGGGYFYVVTLDEPDVSTLSFDNFHLLKQYNSDLSLRQVLIGNQDSPTEEDQDGADIYIAGNSHEAVFDWEYNGGDISDPDSYTEYTIFQDDTTLLDVRISKMILGDDMDGDGYKEVVFSSMDISSTVKPHFYVLEHEGPTENYIVTYNVDVSEIAETLSGDWVVNVSGSWNWNNPWLVPLSDADGDNIWTGSDTLEAGTYEYLFVITGDFDDWSGWGMVGNPPLGSECDFIPDDNWANYGFTITDEDLNLDTVCWMSCEPCDSGEESISVEHISGWNLVGLPVEVPDASPSVVYPNSIPGTLYEFSGTYNNASYLTPGNGFWLNFPDDGSTAVTGSPIINVTVSLSQGWNLFSGITQSTTVSNISDPDGIIVPGTVYGFSGTYVEQSNLIPGKGYWINANADGAITITNNATERLIPGFLDRTVNANKLTINDRKLYFGVNIPENELYRYQLPPKPPIGAFDVRFDDNLKVANSTGIIEIMNNKKVLNISYEINIDEGDNWKWVLNILDENVDMVNLSGAEEIVITENVTHLKLNKIPVLPFEYSLNQNFPNPFNPTTNISFSIPRDGKVNLSVFDLNGHRVKELINGNINAGVHFVTWSGFNNDGKPVSSGVYLYIIKNDSFSAMKKMIFIK